MQRGSLLGFWCIVLLAVFIRPDILASFLEKANSLFEFAGLQKYIIFSFFGQRFLRPTEAKALMIAWPSLLKLLLKHILI
jgi:hypothetical protein